MRDTERFYAHESHRVSKPLQFQRLAIEACCLLEPCAAGKKFNCPEALILYTDKAGLLEKPLGKTVWREQEVLGHVSQLL